MRLLIITQCNYSQATDKLRAHYTDSNFLKRISADVNKLTRYSISYFIAQRKKWKGKFIFLELGTKEWNYPSLSTNLCERKP